MELEKIFESWNSRMKDLTEKLGGKEFDIQTNIKILFGVPMISTVTLGIKFENGKHYANSGGNFNDCIKELEGWIKSPINKHI